MSFFQWSEQYSVGNAVIDQDHKKLFALTQAYFTALKNAKAQNVIDKTLSDLAAYTQTHFSREERMMSQAGYPDLENHRRVHQDLVAKVLGLKGKASDGGSLHAVETANFLRDWLQGHIMKTDKKYAPFLQKAGL